MAALTAVLHWNIAIILCFFQIETIFCSIPRDEFTEELLVKPFASGHVYSHFQFTTKWNLNTDSSRISHFHLFPKSLGEIIKKYNVRELHYSLTQGLWRHEMWGYPVIDSPPGAELWVWFQDWTEDVDKTWSELTQSLSGLLCASLNFIDSTNSVKPLISFRPLGISASAGYAENSTLVRYSALPREMVCIENLTPWKKLLPCDGKIGLSTLLNGGHIYNTNYHAITINVRPVCGSADCLDSALELSQSLSLVSEPIVMNNNGKKDWSFLKLYGGVLKSSCPLATSTKVYIDVTGNQVSSDFSLTPEPTSLVSSIRSGEKKSYSAYDVKKIVTNNHMLNVVATYQTPMSHDIWPSPILHAHRFVTGFGQEQGGISCQIHNTHWRQPLTIVYMDVIPWYFSVYLHTFTISSNNKQIKPDFLHYIPGKDRERPTLLEVVFTLPPHSIADVSFEYQKALLKWMEYPPDPNHGFYIGSAVISANILSTSNYTSPPQEFATIASSFNASRPSYFVRLHTEPLLVTLPRPDFSMPFNVICLTCTVVALAFGPLHNITTRRLRLKNAPSDSFLAKLKTKVKSKLQSLFAKKEAAETKKDR